MYLVLRKCKVSSSERNSWMLGVFEKAATIFFQFYVFRLATPNENNSNNYSLVASICTVCFFVCWFKCLFENQQWKILFSHVFFDCEGHAGVIRVYDRVTAKCALCKSVQRAKNYNYCFHRALAIEKHKIVSLIRKKKMDWLLLFHIAFTMRHIASTTISAADRTWSIRLYRPGYRKSSRGFITRKLIQFFKFVSKNQIERAINFWCKAFTSGLRFHGVIIWFQQSARLRTHFTQICGYLN